MDIKTQTQPTSKQKKGERGSRKPIGGGSKIRKIRRGKKIDNKQIAPILERKLIDGGVYMRKKKRKTRKTKKK